MADFQPESSAIFFTNYKFKWYWNVWDFGAEGKKITFNNSDTKTSLCYISYYCYYCYTIHCDSIGAPYTNRSSYNRLICGCDLHELIVSPYMQMSQNINRNIEIYSDKKFICIIEA